MPDCEFIDRCLFFSGQMDEKPEMLDIYRKQYCLGESSDCTRFAVAKALGPVKVPDDLMPFHADPPVSYCEVTGKMRPIFDRRGSLERRKGDDRAYFENQGSERREASERRSPAERRKDWDRVSRWSSVYVGKD